ncbi:MAG TPA: hypothetical protein VN520_06420 [Streptomyces sp.]|uniref:hypothetical protein n=1 Tax=Streptomyces sp. TaxID=1931 RepID=UPI002B925945|nr:hypothetical protein [Streptomyces sp.]HWU06016.1 hypothetical protein [Streptomyces sp.]
MTALTLAGCTTGPSDRSGPPRQQDGTAALSSTSQGRELTEAESILIEHAEHILVAKCMEKEGFPYSVAPMANAAERRGGGFVLSDIDWARTHGYGGRLDKKAEQARLSDPNNAYANSLPEAERIRYSRTLDGDPSHGMLSVELPAGGTVETPRSGCWADTREQLYGDAATWFRARKTATSLTPLYVPDLVKDKRLVKAVEAWSRCMREAGHAYAGPDEIREKLHALTQGLSPAQAHATEVDLAVAEATCAVETSLATTARSLEREYRRTELRRYSDAVATYQRMRLAALSRAEDVIASES